MDTQALNNCLQKKLRASVKFSVKDTQIRQQYQTIIFVGSKGIFIGSWCATLEAAQQNALQEVLSILDTEPEHEIRRVCGIPPRPHLNEFDSVRDQLRVLRQRVNGMSIGKRRALVEVGKLYTAVDQCEREVMRITGLADPEGADFDCV